ncbi:MAG: ABC transporter permease [Anaerocolumna sp.]
MQVFKLYFKILKSAAPALIIYVFIFTILIFIMSANQRKNTADYEESQINTALVNYDGDSILVRDFLDYLAGYCNMEDYWDNENDLADALFFREVEYILTIPYDFGEDFMDGKDVSVEKKAIPDGAYNLLIDNAINNYLNTARIYLRTMPDISEEELVTYIRNDMKVTTEVYMDTEEIKDNGNSFYNHYFNTASVVLLSCCLMGVGMIMLTFHNLHILRRNMVTPMTYKEMNLQLIGGNIIFVLTYDIFFILIGVIFNGNKSLNGNVFLYWLNLIIFSISAFSISYLTAMLIKSKQANDVLSIVLPLGLSFISGAFIPQFLLGDSVLKMAGFTPFYWFVKGNDTIAGLVNFNWDNLKYIFSYMLIQIGFAAALFALALVVGKSKSQNNF